MFRGIGLRSCFLLLWLIILQKAVKIKSDDTPEVLQRRVMEKAEWKILPKAINLIANDKVKVVDGRVETEEFDTEE